MVFIIAILVIILISNHHQQQSPRGYTHESIKDLAENAKTIDEYYKLTRPIDEYNEMTGNNIWK